MHEDDVVESLEEAHAEIESILNAVVEDTVLVVAEDDEAEAFAQQFLDDTPEEGEDSPEEVTIGVPDTWTTISVPSVFVDEIPADDPPLETTDENLYVESPSAMSLSYDPEPISSGMYIATNHSLITSELADQYGIDFDAYFGRRKNVIRSITNVLETSLARMFFEQYINHGAEKFSEMIQEPHFIDNVCGTAIGQVSHDITDSIFDAWIDTITTQFVTSTVNLSERDNDEDSDFRINNLDLDTALAAYEENHSEAASGHIRFATEKFFGKNISDLRVISFTAEQISLRTLLGDNVFPSDFDRFKGSFVPLKDYNSFVGVNGVEKPIPIVNNRIYGLIMMAIMTKKIYLLDFTKTHITFAYDPASDKTDLTPLNAETIRQFVDEYEDCLRLSKDNLTIMLSSVINIWKQDLTRFLNNKISAATLALAIKANNQKAEEKYEAMRKHMKDAEMDTNNIEGFSWA